MLTNEMIKRIHDNAVAHGFHDPDVEPTFGEYCALIHEEISEAFSAWRNGEPDEYVKDGKPEGVWVELADVVIRIGDIFGKYDVKIVQNEYYGKMYSDILETVIKTSNTKIIEAVVLLHDIVSKAHLCGNSKDSMKWLSSALMCTFALAEHNNIDLDAVIERKHAYNVTRPRLHGKRM